MTTSQNPVDFYTPNFDSLEASLHYFGSTGEFGLPLRVRLQTLFGPETNRSNIYTSLLRVSENYYSKHKNLRGRDARQLATDALALSNDPDRELSAIDEMIIEMADNYAKLIKDNHNPTFADKQSAALQSMNGYKLCWTKVQDRDLSNFLI